jgi:hypothetical protein
MIVTDPGPIKANPIATGSAISLEIGSTTPGC